MGFAALALALALLPTSTSFGQAPAAPHCGNPDRHASMLLAGALTVSPQPDDMDATPLTQISLVGVPASSLSDVQVTGSQSGAHSGRLEPYSQGDGASFVLARPFAEGERVKVSLRALVDGHARTVGWSFTVGYKAGLGAAYRLKKAERADVKGHAAHVLGSRAHAADANRPLGGGTSRSFHSQPNLHPPRVYVKDNRGAAQPGFLFMSPFGSGQAGPMILSDSGGLIWFHPVNTGPLAASKATNLKVQRYLGKPVLTFWQDPRRSANSDRRKPEDVLLDSSYRRIATVHGGNGLVADVHAFHITPQGTALLAIKHDVRCDLSGIGGSADASVWDDVAQEVDIATGLVRWEWNSLDHVGLKEAYDSPQYATPSYPFDFFHLNSIQPLEDNGMLLSARNTWTVYDVDHRTGLVRWRLGGKHSNFRMGKGTRTAWQHDAKATVTDPSSHQMLVTVFDNGATPKEHPQSRGIEELLDLRRHTATLKRAFTHTPPLLAGSQGSVEVMSDGNTVVGWGQEPWMTEYSHSGNVLFNAHLGPLEQSYRALRYEWQGTPATPPKIALQHPKGGRVAVYASWNGATELASWSVLEGSSTDALSPVASSPRTGFETRIIVPAKAPIVEAEAKNAEGETIGTSKPLRLR